jgi:anaerobic selenocysteine-containing dehydrogenase
MEEKRIIRSACRMCHGVCQVLVHMEGERVVKVTGDPDSPTSRGYICPKGAASPELLYHPNRVLHPLRRKGSGRNNERISWDQAPDEMAGKPRRYENGMALFFGMTQGRQTVEIRPAFNAYGTPNLPRRPCLLLAACFCEYGNAGLHRAPSLRHVGGRMVPRCVIIEAATSAGRRGRLF